METKKIIVTDEEQLAAKGVQIFAESAQASVDRKGSFAVAISGGSTPRPMHRLLADKPFLEAIPWKETHIFMVDERMVPYDHHDSNFGTANQDFLDKLPIPAEQIHPMPVKDPPPIGAQRYQKELEQFFDTLGYHDPIFDLIILGIGNDGHTASLFPGNPFKDDDGRWVLSIKGGHPDLYRLTLNYHVLNKAKRILFLVSKKGKAEIVKSVFEDRYPALPASRVRPPTGKVLWLLDQAAASLLPK
jgi:6-phosphogluconolactonase